MGGAFSIDLIDVIGHAIDFTGRIIDRLACAVGLNSRSCSCLLRLSGSGLRAIGSLLRPLRLRLCALNLFG
ncbi:MAG: hypothetical protein HY269_09200 [Deltaproteobacteria bacterium]|nr:hypothetical protein [Deltaproteobacteria bacterium]